MIAVQLRTPYKSEHNANPCFTTEKIKRKIQRIRYGI
jgi:hypothetical protein